VDVQEALRCVKDSDELKNWLFTHAGGFLAHAFVMLDEANKDSVQVGYYFPLGDSMTTFVVSPGGILVSGDQQVIQTEKGVHALDVSAIKISQVSALETADEKRLALLGSEPILKTFFILQDLGEGPVFNVTFFSQAFKTFNCRVSAVDGKILHESVQKLADLSGKR